MVGTVNKLRKYPHSSQNFRPLGLCPFCFKTLSQRALACMSFLTLTDAVKLLREK